MVEESLDLNILLRELQETIIPCFEIKEEYWGNHPSALFHSHFDWHSSVHAHWAMLSSSRMNKFVGVEKVLLRFNEDDLKLERDYLISFPSFELPYGQSWLLLLLQEIQQHWTNGNVDFPSSTFQLKSSSSIKVLQELQQETLNRVINWLQQAPYPDGRRQGSDQQGFCGAHNSWTMSYFLLKMSRLADDDGRMAVIDEKFRSAVPNMTAVTNPHDFHSPLSLANVLLATTDSPVLDTSSVCRPTRIVMDNCHTPGRLPCVLHQSSSSLSIDVQDRHGL